MAQRKSAGRRSTTSSSTRSTNRSTSRARGTTARRGSPAPRAPEPEVTNREAAAPPGVERTVPGAGVVGAAGGDVRTRASEDGRGEAAPPGARRTARAAVRTPDIGDTAPLATPRELAGPTGSAGAAVDETADPNFTAAKPGARGRKPTAAEKRSAEREGGADPREQEARSPQVGPRGEGRRAGRG